MFIEIISFDTIFNFYFMEQNHNLIMDWPEFNPESTISNSTYVVTSIHVINSSVLLASNITLIFMGGIITGNGDLKGKQIALWGLAFKPETDDMREAPALVLIDKLIEAGASVKVYDPIAMDECKRRIGDKVVYATDMYDAVLDADALCPLCKYY